MVPASWLEAAHPTRACTLRNKGIMISGGAEGMTLPSTIMQIISNKKRAQKELSHDVIMLEFLKHSPKMATLLVLSEDLKTENTQTCPKSTTHLERVTSLIRVQMCLQKRKGGTEMKAVLACLCSGSGAFFFLLLLLGFFCLFFLISNFRSRKHLVKDSANLWRPLIFWPPHLLSEQSCTCINAQRPHPAVLFIPSVLSLSVPLIPSSMKSTQLSN